MTRSGIWTLAGCSCALVSLTMAAAGFAKGDKASSSSYTDDPRSGAALNRDAALNPGPAQHPLYPPSPEQRINVLAVNNPLADTTPQDTQSETSIAALGSKVVVAFNDSGSNVGGASHFTGYARSTNGGATFTDQGVLPASAQGDAGDPVLAKDTQTGAFYLSTLMFNTGAGIQVFKSTDGGQTFGAPVNGAPVSGNDDKQWLTVDNFPGSGRHNVYLCYTDFNGTPTIRLTRSIDQGGSFNPGIPISTGNNQGCFVAVGPDHSVYVLFLRNTAGANKLYVRRSTDNGLSFGPEHVVANLNTTTVNGNLQLNGGLRSNSFPHAAVNPVTGDIIAVWNDDPTASTADNGDVFRARSSDGGATWSTPARVNDTGAKDQFFPTVSITPDGKSVMFGYYDRSQDPQNLRFHRQGRLGTINTSTGAISMRRSFQLGPNTPLAIGQDPVVTAAYMGDYDTIDYTDGAFRASWADNRDGNGFHARQPDVRYAQVGTSASNSDVGVTVDPVPGTIPIGDSTDVRVRVSATGGTARDVFVNLSPATGLKFQSASASGSDCDLIDQFVGCSLNNIPDGASRTIHVTAAGMSSGTRTVKASATTTSSDTAQTNNTGSGTVTVDATGTAVGTRSTGNIAVPIPDRGSVDVPLSFPDVGPVLKAKALVRLNHTFDGDLAISLIDPAGHTVLLSLHRGGSGDNYGSGANDCSGTPTTFTDSAATPISSGVPPFAGAFKPAQPLEDLFGDASAGTWTLHVSDDANLDVGTIGCFQLRITHRT